MLKRSFNRLFVLGMCLVVSFCAPANASDWEKTLEARLSVFGHRNWILIADSAYPAQTSPGIEIVLTGDDLLSVLKSTLKAVDKADHIRPVIHLDKELDFITDKDASGIEKHRKKLKDILKNLEVQSLLHEELMERIGEAGEKFQVLVLKTTLVLPYTSVFIQLDCGYWDAQAERSLRRAMEKPIRK